MRHTLAAVLCAILVPATTLAQTTKPPVPHDQILSTNPFGFLVEWFNAEYERKIGDATTIGASASHFVDAGQSNAAILCLWRNALALRNAPRRAEALRHSSRGSASTVHYGRLSK